MEAPGSNNPATGNYYDVGNFTISNGVTVSAGDFDAVTVGAFAQGYSYSGVNNGVLSYTGPTDKAVISFAAGTEITATDVAIAMSGTFTNNGTILGHVQEGSGYGIELDGSLNGSLVNSSSGLIGLDFVNTPITAGSASGTWAAISVGGDVGATGTLTNNGTIRVDVEESAFRTETGSSPSANDASGSFYGIYVSGVVAGTVANSGSISVDVDRATGVSAAGIYSDSVSQGGAVTNSGAINVNLAPTSLDSWGTVIGAGIHVDDVVNGIVTNTATGSIFGEDHAKSII